MVLVKHVRYLLESSVCLLARSFNRSSAYYSDGWLLGGCIGLLDAEID